MPAMGLADAFRPPVVGLDLGSYAVKAVALRPSRSGWALLAAGELTLPAGERVTPALLTETATALLDTLGLRRASVAAALSGQAVIVKRLILPRMRNEELAAAVSSEAEHQIPFALADVQLDYHVFRGGPALPADALDVLLVAARRERISERVAAITATGHRPAVLDVEAFALANAYGMNYPDRTDPLSALIHIGRSSAVVCVLGHGQPVFTRDINIGGAADGEALREVHLLLILEIRKTLDFYWSTTTGRPLSRLVLSGGACQADGLRELVDQEFGTQEFGTTVEFLDPFKRITRSSRAVGAELDGPAFAVAVGLAMRREGDR